MQRIMIVEQREAIERGVTDACPCSWLTVEVALYAGLAILALSVRLAALGRFPLSLPEAETAVAAWRAAQGDAWRPEAYSPLLFDANLLLFWLTRATDGAARLLPALVGAALVVAPWAVRRTVGRTAALLMAALFALAPSWVYTSRANDWPIVAAASVALLLVTVDRYLQTGAASDARRVAVALGLALMAGPAVVTPLLVLGALGVAWARRHPILGPARLRGLVVGAATPTNLALVVGVLAAVGSALWVNPGGIGAAANLVWRWFADLAPDASDRPWSALPVALLTYEFLTIGLATVGAVAGLRRRESLDQFLVAWAALALGLGVLLGHRGPQWVLDALLPLVVLAGRGGAYLWRTLRDAVTWADAVALVVAVVLVIFALLELAAWIHTTQQPFLIYGLFVIGVLVLAWIGFYWWGQPVQAVRVGVTVLLLVAVGLTVRTTTAIAYQTARDPREPLVGQAMVPHARDMEAFLTLLSDRTTGDQRALDVAYDRALDPWAGWYLRRFAAAQSAAGVGRVGTQATVLVTGPDGADPGLAGYVGQRFILTETWPAQSLSLREYLHWFLYRAPVGAVERSYLHVWVQAPGDALAIQRTSSTP
jgi:hypothetical protein